MRTIPLPGRLTVGGLAALALLGTSACSVFQSNDSGGGSKDGAIAVAASESSCDVAAESGKAGTLVFDVTNKGSKVTEFELLAEDGLRILGEVENVGPGLTRQLVVSAPEGKYQTACIPGMVGKGMRNAFTVEKGAKGAGEITGVDAKTIDAATAQYASYVKNQSGQLLVDAKAFTAAYTAGDDDKARALYPTARMPWEAVEPVAESFGDLDPKTDLREADLEKGQKWTGWHRIEKDLWPPKTGYTALTPAQRKTYAADLMTNLTTLNTRVKTLDFGVDQIANGSKGLLDEVAASKITGEEDIWSHTDLYDFQANVTGAKAGFEVLKPLLQVKDPELATTLDQRFTAMQTELDEYRDGDGFVTYTQVTEAQRKQLSDAVNALAEPLSKVTAALTL
ncbi:lipoprotein [Marmoricola endophyticus]|uniref:Lipoprotein n=1 Tax=Marmoricola endophyticus TaxID=2040280 RepID=A0A917BGF2_9ACTN|nr:iron uptake system protein EfeO [Marmoricola endophyticus]GGF41699.1 lipoprotein [Marmoricola endophyticus]